MFLGQQFIKNPIKLVLHRWHMLACVVATSKHRPKFMSFPKP